MTHLVPAMLHVRCPDRGSVIGALPVPRLPSSPLRGVGASADGHSVRRAAEHGPPTEYLPRVGQLDLPCDGITTTAMTVEDEQARAATAARPQPDPDLDVLSRVLRGLRRL